MKRTYRRYAGKLIYTLRLRLKNQKSPTKKRPISLSYQQRKCDRTVKTPNVLTAYSQNPDYAFLFTVTLTKLKLHGLSLFYCALLRFFVDTHNASSKPSNS